MVLGILQRNVKFVKKTKYWRCESSKQYWRGRMIKGEREGKGGEVQELEDDRRERGRKDMPMKGR